MFFASLGSGSQSYAIGWGTLTLINAGLAQSKGRSGLAWFLLSLLLGPIATLLIDGKTVGRHFAGPSWELADGSAVTGKIAGRAAGATPKDIPLLKLEAASHRGSGQLTGVTTIQRLNTKGGVVEGACDSAGAFLSVPYSADYTFLKKGS